MKLPKQQHGSFGKRCGVLLAMLLAISAAAQGLLACNMIGKAPSGAILFRRARCTDCHGVGGVGSTNGPPLVDIRSKWSVELLTEFIGDPESFRVRDERLDELAVRFNSRMTPFDTLPESDRRILANYLVNEREQ